MENELFWIASKIGWPLISEIYTLIIMNFDEQKDDTLKILAHNCGVDSKTL